MKNAEETVRFVNEEARRQRRSENLAMDGGNEAMKVRKNERVQRRTSGRLCSQVVLSRLYILLQLNTYSYVTYCPYMYEDTILGSNLNARS